MNLHDAVTLDDPSPTENLNRVQRLSQSEFICLTIDLEVVVCMCLRILYCMS